MIAFFERLPVRWRKLLDLFRPEELPSLEGAVQRPAQQLADALVESGDIRHWSGWRLVGLGEDEYVQHQGGQWPVIARMEYAAEGEGGQPTLYIEPKEMPGWAYCVHLDAVLTLIPPDHA